MSTWSSNDEPEDVPLSPLVWAIAICRGIILMIVIYSFMILLALARLLESPFKSNPVSPLIVQFTCKFAMVLLNIKITTHGRAMKHKGAIVCNHASWLDVFTLNAVSRVFFVSKSEVRKWPVIGLVARSAGTVFIERRASQAKHQKTQFQKRLVKGDRLLFFPEGTSTDNRRVIPFKSTLFAAFFEQDLASEMWLQPASLIYHAPKGEDVRFYGWWGEMGFFYHFIRTLGAKRKGRADIIFHEPVRVSDFKDRKELSRYCQRESMRGVEDILGPEMVKTD